jgi:tRNA (mo5U34)-methyltransferase
LEGRTPALAASEELPPVTDAERAVADLLPIEAVDGVVSDVLERVPLWFHTFSLGNGAYTPGVARDHRYRVPFLPEDLSGASVLDVGTFDGFYAFLAESRGAERVVAVDNEQYREWVRARWGVELEGGEGFRAIGELLGSRVEYVRLDAFELGELEEEFDLVLCFGLLHRVENPLGLLRVLRECVAPGGELLLETYGVASSLPLPAIEVRGPGDVYADDDYVYWGFGSDGLRELARRAGFDAAEVLDTPLIDGHPRLLVRLRIEP